MTVLDSISLDSLTKAEAFWRDFWHGYTAPLQLPVITTPSLPSRTNQYIRFSSHTTANLANFLQNHQLSFYSLIQGAWTLLLSHYTRETDIVFGALAQESDFQLVPVRVHVNFQHSVLSWLKDLQEKWQVVSNYSFTPWAKIREWSEVSGDLPLFTTVVKFGQETDWREQGEYALVLSVNCESDFLLKIESDRTKFSDEALNNLLAQIENIINSVITNPEQKLSDISILTEREKQQLLFEWNQVEADYDQEKCIHELFAEQVARNPDAVAVVWENQQITYQELNCRSNQLAQYLQTLGVKPEVLVGICTERSLEMIVGILAILKAGGAYVPLDMAYPKERLALMLSDSQVSILLTQKHLVEKLPPHQARIICLDDMETELGKISTKPENPESGVKPGNLAYIIYTSGSTGQPKGVMIPHSNVLRLFAATQSWFKFNQNDIWSLFHSYAFDFSVWEIWGALLYGGRLVIIPYDVSRSPELFYNLLIQEQVTVLNQTPSAFQQLIQLEESENYHGNLSLRLVIFGGEGLDIQSLKPWFARHGDQYPQLVNMYGITETTVHVTYRPLTLADAESSTKVIGRTIPDLQLYILNDQLQPVPVGVTGEMYVGGAGLARGYLHREELTSARFISHPFYQQTEARLYKTGDLARYLANGEIEYLGRSDNQVKIRGFRIELGEIEALLNQFSGIRSTKVIVREDIPGDKRIVAYILFDADKNYQTDIDQQLREYLKRKLPDYMLPSAFVVMESFPLTTNGKIDFATFPVPSFSQHHHNYIAPRTPQEEILADIWSEVLKIQPISIYDHFFELGGHSLLATQVISRIRKTFGVDLSVRLLFEFPTIEQFSAQLGIIKQNNNTFTVPAIGPEPQPENIPLSFAQQRLWFLDQFEAKTNVYNIPYTLRLQGALNIPALEQSIGEILQRHQILRSNFLSKDGKPFQVISDNLVFSLPVIDLQALEFDQAELEAQKIASQEAQNPVNLAEDALFRVKLIILNAQQYILLFNIHHIIFDGWSFGVLFEEIKTLYQAFCLNQSSPLAQLPIQYADFSLWQRQWLTDEVLASQLNYWKQQLSGMLPVLELPIDYPSPPVQTYQGHVKNIVLSEELTADIETLAKKHDVTLFMTLLAAFKVLLSRYSGQEDIIVGTPIAGRDRTETESLIGFFVNTLALRTDLNGNPSFVELLNRVKKVCLEAYTHQDLPFEKLVEQLQPTRDLSHSPIFQVMFALQNTPKGELDLPNLTVTPLAPPIQTAKFDLTLSMEERKGRLIAEWEYNTDLFDHATVERMMQHFPILLSGIVAHPDQSIWKLPLLTEWETQKLLVDWNQTAVSCSQDKLIHQLFEEQAEKTPDTVAVKFAQQQLTYRELNQRANQLAHYLQKLGVGAEKLVGLCLEPGLERIVGLLGIFKAGGVYLPLDPVYPQERLNLMVKDSQVAVVVTETSLVSRFGGNLLEVVNLDADWEKIETESVNNPQSCITGENLAYVIYTSGSTGIPKGVLIEHQAIAAHCQNIIETYQLSCTDRILQFAALSFDVSLEQILPSLAIGATLFLVDGKMLTVSEFQQKLIDDGLTVVDIPPVYWSQWVQSLNQNFNQTPIPQLRLVICGGETFPAESLKIWQNHLISQQVKLVNAYGPTETTITALTFDIPQGTVPTPSYNNIPIGRPLKNRQAYILDNHKNLVPIGVAGELYLGGEGLARGYLNRPDLTNDKFIENPFHHSTVNTKLYQTGDLVRYLPDGNIQYLGRIDNQVKIRGFRIELGEIETVLNQYPAIKAAKVIAREDIPGDKRLIAYIILNDLGNESESEISQQLREYLKHKLPDYMIPAAFVPLSSFPVTANGKIDITSLPVPSFSQNHHYYIAPRTPQEEILANLWSEVLKIQPISIDDNFFELGGHSLLAIQVISRIRNTFGLDLSVRLLFEFPTIAQLSVQLGIIKQNNNTFTVPAIGPEPQPENIPLSFPQQRLWFLNQLEANTNAYNMPYALRLQGALNIPALEQSIGEIIQRHQILRTNFILVDGEPLQVISPNLVFSLPVIDLQTLPSDQAELKAQNIIHQEAQKPVDLAKDSLFRVKLLILNSQQYILLFNIHHIIFDGWSFGILFEELKTLYPAFCQNESSPLTQLPIQYADFSLWQRKWLTGEVLTSQLNYWKQQLSGILPVLELPIDYPRPPVQNYQGAAENIYLSLELTANIKTLAQKHDVTLFMTLLAAFKVLLSRYSGQTDIIVGTPSAGRDRTETEALIGFFVNTLALRTDLTGNPTFIELLNRVKKVCLEAYTHQDLPFEKLVEELQPTRDLSRTPIFQVWFNMVNLASDNLELNGLKVEPIPVLETASKFDLSLYIREQNHRLHLQLVYNTLLFNSDTIQWIASHLNKLLAEIVKNPTANISSFSLFTPSERYELSQLRNLVKPQNKFHEFPKSEIEQSISQRFIQQVQKYPENIAVKTKNYQWTYRELNLQADKIAQILQKSILSQDAKIALLFEHDAPMIAAILAVIKLGLTYIPLDPKYPQERVLYILQDSVAEVVLTNDKNLEQAQKLTLGKLPIININQINFNSSSTEINQSISPDTIAYILYTSGSTGKPKGVYQNHRNVLHFIRNYTNNLHISPQDKLTLFSSYSFDAAVIDIFSALLNGATLYPFDIKTEGLTTLSHWLNENQITVYHSTPTVYRYFIQTLENTQLPQLRLVVLGGEEVVKSDVEAYQKYFADECIFVNGLGSTESSFNLQYLIDKNTKINQKLVPVGYPFDDTEILLLDAAENQTEIFGEIAIRGPHLALGYWQKPELTKIAFFDNFQNGNQRIYRTGDLGRLKPNGTIEFLGRKDFQVKIRGFRVELGEIEAVLNQHPSIKENVVIAREDISGEKRLFAYIVPHSNQTSPINQINQYLKLKLPDYMIPSGFVLLDVMPLTPNGKINRLALPAPNLTTFSSEKSTTPADNLELQLIKIWENVLGVKAMGVNDNFFDLGGHSLLAVRLFNQIEKEFGQNIPLANIFQFPTIKQLANLLRKASFTNSCSSLVSIQPNGSKPPFFYIHTIYGTLFHSRHLLSRMPIEQPIYGLQAQGLNSKESLHTSIAEMASHYIQEIQTVQPKGPYLLGGWCAGGMIAFEMAQQLTAKGEKVALLAIFDAYPPKLMSATNKPLQSLYLGKIKSSIHQNILGFIDMMKRNLREFFNLSLLKKIIFIREKINRIIKNNIQENLYLFCLKLNLPLPEKLRNLALRDTIAQAYHNYSPTVYNGKITFFRALDQPGEYAEYLAKWQEIAAGGLEIHDIPGHHDSIIVEPHVNTLAEKLKFCLQQVTETETSL